MGVVGKIELSCRNDCRLPVWCVALKSNHFTYNFKTVASKTFLFCPHTDMHKYELDILWPPTWKQVGNKLHVFQYQSVLDQVQVGSFV